MPVSDVKSRLWGTLSAYGLAIALGVILVDQANKWWLIAGYGIGERGRVALTPFLDLVYVKNTGISYGLFSSSGLAGQFVLVLFAAVVALGLMVWLSRVETRRLAAAIGLVVGGALANAIDRLVIGGVADFYSLHAFGFYWYIFNLADVAIVAGAALLLYDSLWPSRKKVSNGA